MPRIPLLVPGMLALVIGVLAGLARLGVEVPAVAAMQAGSHAALMVCAFFGTVISLERAVALARPLAYVAPLASGLGGLALLTGVGVPAGQVLFVVASTVLLAGSVAIMKRQLALFTATLAVGASCWLVGNLAWLATDAIQTAIPWWLAFLVLTIAGERLELTRFLPRRPAAAPLFVVAAALVIVGAVAGVRFGPDGQVVFSLGLLALALWLLRYDIARHNARQQGLVRYIALCLLSGYVWLGVGALAGAGGGLEPGHAWRDATLHAIGLGFVFAMVFGHAPIIFPAIARVRIPWHPAFYLPLIVLHGSLLLRIGGGGIADGRWRESGGILNALALLLFIVTIAVSVVRGRSGKA